MEAANLRLAGPNTFRFDSAQELSGAIWANVFQVFACGKLASRRQQAYQPQTSPGEPARLGWLAAATPTNIVSWRSTACTIRLRQTCGEQVEGFRDLGEIVRERHIELSRSRW